MNLPVRVDDQTVYVLQIDRYRPSPRPAWHNFLPPDRAELFVLHAESVAHATVRQISALTDHLVQIYEGGLESMGLGIDLYEWNFADLRLMRMICAAVLARRHPDMLSLKAKWFARKAWNLGRGPLEHRNASATVWLVNAG